MIGWLSTFSLCVSMISLQEESSTGGFNYYYYRFDVSSDGPPNITIWKDGISGSIRFRDVGVFAKFCSDDSEFICFENPLMAFALPRKQKEDGLPPSDNWEYSGHKYSLRTDQRRLAIFGHEITAFEFEKDEPIKKSRFRYLFSRHNGLVAVLMSYPGEDLAVFVSAHRCGFGASPACHESGK